eukprot:gnl/Spiro4/12738_TR6753_c1_g1_i4.p1 gnl/Spiro4/12738_TR6753_c1_g1~~gnl/Spiro4/12738_TR6753_c1_g1_i4.p1  ORF type:complete len:750 (-),score=200.80 gnl/Spiro4/12738_TR6753_c1_g1_i4:4-2196(-)
MNGLILEFSDLDTSGFREYLKDSPVPFQASQLYNSQTDSRVVDESLRKSAFRTFTDPHLFALSEKFVDQVNARCGASEPLRFFLVRNDITHIVYHEGEFFKRHSDFLSVTSNFVEEFTLIVCVTPDEIAATTRGGHTRLFPNPEHSYDSVATVTPGRALVFRKDIPHEGLVLEAGEKHIVTMNLWGTRRADVFGTAGPSVLLVEFAEPNPSAMPPHTTATTPTSTTTTPTSTPSSTHDLATSQRTALHNELHARSYAISAADIMAYPDSVLARYLAFAASGMSANSAADDPLGARLAAAEVPVVRYEETGTTYEQFEPVFRILCRMPVSVLQLEQARVLIDYYNIDPRCVLAYAVADAAVASSSSSSSSSSSLSSVLAQVDSACTDVIVNRGEEHGAVWGHNEDGGVDDVGLMYLVHARIWSAAGDSETHDTTTNSNKNHNNTNDSNNYGTSKQSGDNNKHDAGALHPRRRLLEDFTAYTYTGSVAGKAFGWNSHGLVVTYNAIVTQQLNPYGLPRYFVNRLMYRARSVREALGLAAAPTPLASTAFSMNLGQRLSASDKATELVNVEIDPIGTHAIRSIVHLPHQPPSPPLPSPFFPQQPSHFIHTNHYLQLATPNWPSNSSVHRFARAASMCGAHVPASVADVCEVLGDTADLAYPIYRGSGDAADESTRPFARIPDARGPCSNDTGVTLATVVFDFGAQKIFLWEYSNPRLTAPARSFDLPLPTLSL